MKHKLLFPVFFIFISFSLNSQNSLTYIGVDGGIKWDMYRLTDYGDGMFNKPVAGFKSGITIGHEFSNNMFFETGIYYNQLWESYRYKPLRYSYGYGNANLLFNLPLRYKYRYPFFGNKLSLTGSAGLILAYNTDYKQLYREEGRISQSTSSDSVSSRIYVQYSNNMILPFAEIGLSLDYTFKNQLTISLSDNYTLGLVNVYSKDIHYKINDLPEQSAKITSKGSANNVLFSIKFPISNIWDKSEANIKRKQNLKEDVSESRKKRYYISAEAGIYRPFFSSDNANITGDEPDMILIYNSDAFYGINLGIEIHKGFFTEVGFDAQNFTNKYMINIGNAGFGSAFSSGINYFSVPGKIKYMFNFSDRFSFVPFIGASVLFSNKTGLYGHSSSTGYCNPVSDQINIVEYSSAYREKNPVISLTGGGGIEFAASKNIILTLNASYEKGFNNFNRLNVYYKSGDNTETGNVFYKGSNYKIFAGVKIPFDF